MKTFLVFEEALLNCPFLKENGIAIGEKRLRQIKQSLLDDDMAPFQCHKTTHPTGGYHDEDGVYISLARKRIVLSLWAFCTPRGWVGAWPANH